MSSDVKLQSDLPERVDADLLVVGVRPGSLDASPVRRFDAAMQGAAAKEIARRGFEARPGTSIVLPTYGALAARNLVLFGLGGEPDAQKFRLLGEAATHNGHNLRAQTVAIDAQGLSADQISAVAEGIELSGYRFLRYKGTANRGPEATLRMTLVASENTADQKRALEEGSRMAAATNFARDLINTPAEDATPEFLAEQASGLAKENGLECEISDRAGIMRLKMGALLGVAKASPREPRFIQLRYRPAHAANGHVALVGKGITFDSGTEP